MVRLNYNEVCAAIPCVCHSLFEFTCRFLPGMAGKLLQFQDNSLSLKVR